MQQSRFARVNSADESWTSWEAVTLNSPWSLSLIRQGIDRLVAGILAVLTLPVVVVCLAVSAVVFRASPLFVQQRVGLNGRLISVPKIRSLPTSVDSTADKYALRKDSYNGWSNLLRRSHLDELPQLWSVAKGDMSIVGPRPEMPSLSSRYPADFVKVRTSVRPGITGAWQISEALAGLIYEAPEYDREYVATASPRLDAWILWRTVRGIFGGDPINLTELKARTSG